MRILKHFIILFVIVILILNNYSCKKSEKEIEKAFLTNALIKIKLDKNIKWIVIMPGLGCTGCIQEGEAFMKKYIQNNEIFFILTNISSLKILEQKIDIKIKDHPNLLIDRENSFIVPTDNCVYPCIVQLKYGKILSHEFQCPKNGQAFNKLKRQITEH